MIMKKIIIFGAGPTGKRMYDFYKDICEIVAFTDNNEKLHGTEYNGIPIVAPYILKDAQYDFIVIASVPGYDSIYHQLQEIGVDCNKIKNNFSGATYDRNKIFRQYAEELGQVEGECAELGVFQGNTASIINKVFPNRKLYLFDTFSGFDERDVVAEKNGKYSEAKRGEYKDTSVEMVLGKMKNPDTCVIRKGYFPETTIGLEEKFAFVRMDVDLYKPTKAGLEWFGERMTQGSMMILHDYYTESYGGVRQAVDEYVENHSYIRRVSAGDGLSVILIGFRGEK